MIVGLLKKYWFLLGVVAAASLGLALPEAAGRLNPRSLTTNGIVVVLFVITGLSLSTDTVWKGLRDLRLHLYLQLFIFVLTPAYFLGSLALLRGVLPGSLDVGILALACLPTTVSSCVVFTQTAGGNAAGAMFSSTLANGLGVLVSPLLLSFLLRGAQHALPPSEVARILVNLGLTILVPFAVGQGLRLLFARRFASKQPRGAGGGEQQPHPVDHLIRFRQECPWRAFPRGRRCGSCCRLPTWRFPISCWCWPATREPGC